MNMPVGHPDPALLFDNQLSNSINLLTIHEAAKLLTVSVPTVRRLQTQRDIPFVKIGGSVRFDKRDIVAYVTRNRIEPIGT